MLGIGRVYVHQVLVFLVFAHHLARVRFKVLALVAPILLFDHLGLGQVLQPAPPVLFLEVGQHLPKDLLELGEVDKDEDQCLRDSQHADLSVSNAANLITIVAFSR